MLRSTLFAFSFALALASHASAQSLCVIQLSTDSSPVSSLAQTVVVSGETLPGFAFSDRADISFLADCVAKEKNFGFDVEKEGNRMDPKNILLLGAKSFSNGQFERIRVFKNSGKSRRSLCDAEDVW